MAAPSLEGQPFRPVTMGKIRLLPPYLISQIAAGEVIERPASVVKELVENSLDAGAKRIEVRVKKGGIGRIEVVDDGVGIEREDLKLALAHHATSKIRETDDLFALKTFGFRGEALPSIASVARLTLISRPRGSGTAWKIECREGQLSEIVPTPHPEGTRVVVEELFYTVPARRKFLRTPRTEMGHIATWIHRFALAHFGVEFLLIEGKRPRGRFEIGEPERRLAQIFGSDFAERALAKEVEAEGLFLLRGWLAPGGVEAASSEGVQQFWFVNRRPVREKQLYRALREAYEMAGLKPGAAVLYLEVPLEAVDVNVHPAKLEVRFREGQRLYERLVEQLTKIVRGAPQPRGEPPPVEPVKGGAFPRLQVAERSPLYGPPPERPVGLWVEGRYWIGQEEPDRQDGGVVVVDVEAVRRELAEEVVARSGERPLTTPLCLELSEETASLVAIVREALAPFGLELDRIGTKTITVRSLPDWLSEERAEGALRRLFATIGEFSEESLNRWAVETLAEGLEGRDWLQEARRLDREGQRLWRRLTPELIAKLLDS